MPSIRFHRGRINLKNFVFEVTQDCNQSCLYCYNVWRHREYPKGELSVRDWETIVVKLKEETKVKLVSISGGEPLLYPNLVELIEMVRSHGIKVNLLTNGSLIDGRTAKLLVESGISIFEIPLVSADKAVHHRLKGVDDFDKVVEGIANIFHCGGRIVTAFVATKENIANIEETIEFAIALGSQGLMFNRINPAHREDIDLLPTREQLQVALAFLHRFVRKHGFPVTSSIPIQPCIINMRDYPGISYGYCPSGKEKSYYTIDSVGNVRICNHSPTILGNILTESMKSMIDSKFAREFKEVIPDFCVSCSDSKKCRGGCKAAAQVCYGELCNNDPLLQANLDKLHPI